MKFRRYILALAGCGYLGCGQGGNEELEGAKGPLLNGVQAVDDAERLRSPVVSIVGASPFKPWASGTLIGERTVLTAAHVLRPPGLVPEDARVDHAMVDGAGASGTSAGVTMFTPYPAFDKGNKRFRGADIAIIRLDQPLGGPELELPQIECESPAISQLLECQSGVRHTKGAGGMCSPRSSTAASSICSIRLA